MLHSLQVLHKFLDNQEVSFVAITNHVLDAAKTNRAVSLFRSNYVQVYYFNIMKSFEGKLFLIHFMLQASYVCGI